LLAPPPAPPPAAPEDVAGSSDQVIRLGAARIDVVSSSPAPRVAREILLAWVRRASGAVAGFYGDFPVLRSRVQLRRSSRPGVRHGRVVARDLPTIFVSVGDGTEQRHLDGDWRLTHEMVHLAFPHVASRHHWLEEGLATYVEPIARARAGWLSEDAVWLEWMENMPLGVPAPGGAGFDADGSWAVTYWGGALFCLLADVELREVTSNRVGLPHALRAILAQGGNMERAWPLSRVLGVADRATGTNVVSRLYESLGRGAPAIDLPGLFRRLGVARTPTGVAYDDAAPLAHVRRALVLGEPDQPSAARRWPRPQRARFGNGMARTPVGASSLAGADHCSSENGFFCRSTASHQPKVMAITWSSSSVSVDGIRSTPGRQ
jgi:hypothetical protein